MKRFLFLIFLLAIKVNAINYINESFEVKDKGALSRIPKKRVQIFNNKTFEKTLNVDKPFFAEVFFRSMDPKKDFQLGNTLMTLTIGLDQYSVKLKDWNLQVLANQKIIATYPLYRLFNYQGMSIDESWHYLLFTKTEKNCTLYFDGFKVCDIDLKSIKGNLTKIVLGSKRPTAFADLRVSDGVLGNSEEIRKRYLQLYQGKIPISVLPLPIISIPYIDEELTLNDLLTEKKIKQMAQIPLISISHLASNCYDNNDISAFIAQSKNTLYLQIKTLYQGKLKTTLWNKHDAPLWNEEAWEFFLRPANKTFQFLGNPHGNLCDLLNGEISWNSKVKYQAILKDNYWMAVWAIPLEKTNPADKQKDDKIYQPQNGSQWRINLFNSHALKGWNRSFPYFNANNFGIIVFDKAAPAIRINNLTVKDKKVKAALEFTGSQKTIEVTATLSITRYGEITPECISKKIKIKANELVPCTLTISKIDTLPVTLQITVTYLDKIIFRSTGHLPKRSDLLRK